MIKKVVMAVSGAGATSAIAALLTQKAMIAFFLPIFILGFVVATVTFEKVWVRLRLAERRGLKLLVMALYSLLWSGFVLFFVTAGVSYV